MLVLQETVTDGTGNLIQKIVYTIGHDHISQSTWRAGDVSPPSVAVFHFDGHGNTRILTDLAGTIVTLAGLLQVYHYDAYGNALNFTMPAAATQYLYSGEQFDPRIGQQYLRARYYDSATGTFHRLDLFFGNQTDPQSFHKYLYTHGDPVNGWDPSGKFTSLTGLLSSMSIVASTSAMNIAQGGVVATGLLTFGDAGMKLYRKGQILAAEGNLDLAFQIYELGGEIFGLGAHLIHVGTTALEFFSLGVAIVDISRIAVGFIAHGGLEHVSTLLKALRDSRRLTSSTSHIQNFGKLGGTLLTSESVEIYQALLGSIRQTSGGRPATVSLKVVDSLPQGKRARYVANPPWNSQAGAHEGVIEILDDATVYELHHELQHMNHHLEIGDAYFSTANTRAVREWEVYKRLKQSDIWKKLKPEEREDAYLQTFGPFPEDQSHGPLGLP